MKKDDYVPQFQYDVDFVSDETKLYENAKCTAEITKELQAPQNANIFISKLNAWLPFSPITNTELLRMLSEKAKDFNNFTGYYQESVSKMRNISEGKIDLNTIDLLTESQHKSKSNYKRFKQFKRKYGLWYIIGIDNPEVFSFCEIPCIAYMDYNKNRIIPIIKNETGFFKSKKLYSNYKLNVSRINKGMFKCSNEEKVFVYNSQWICPCCGNKNTGNECCEVCGVMPRLYKFV